MEKHWLVRPGTVRKLWITLVSVLAITVLIQIVIPVHGHFPVEESFAFGAWFGFGACAAMIVFAKVLGILLKRRDDYYEH